MKLAPLLAVLGHSCDQDVDISSLSCDSRTVTPGALFVAIPGEHADGTQYIAQAVDRGAAAVVQLIDMMQKTRCNADLLNRLQDWIALWEKSGYLKR